MTTRLYALGSNSSGQLGIGHCEDVDVPTPCQFIPTPTIYPGVTQLDTSSEGVQLETPSNLDSPICKIVAGGNHTIILCKSGAVYAAGNRAAIGEAIELGSRDSANDELSPQNLAPIFRRVLWWEDSQLLDTFIDVSATWSASFFVVAPKIQDGKVVRFGTIYVCGKGEKGELGLGKNVVEAAKPKRVATFGCEVYSGSMRIETEEIPLMPGMLAGIWSSVAYTVTCSTNESHVFGWGNCRKGQLGNSVKEMKVLWVPRQLADEDLKQHAMDNAIVAMGAVGKDFVLLQRIHGEQQERVREWKLLGGNSFLTRDADGVRGFLAQLTISVPQEELSRSKTSQSAGWSNIYILESRTHKVKALGRNDHGQLPPEGLPELSVMAAGSEHCVGLTLQGKAVTWGWGEHGNCGRESDATGQGWGMLSLPDAGAERAVGVGAGCATTFIWTVKR